MGGFRFAAPLLAATAIVSTSGGAETPRYAYDDPLFDEVTLDGLETFSSDRAFLRYVERVEDLRRERVRRLERQFRREHGIEAEPDEIGDARPGGTQLAALQDGGATATDVPEELLCPSTDPDCGEDGEDVIVLTASRVAGPPASITNNQSAGVDEGDIVKQIGRFLLVLQDGRIFSIDTGDGEDGQLRLADRIDVYRSRNEAADWYDEMLVQDNRVIITAYNYRADATELSIFRMDRDTGTLSRDGVFFISSDDYYSVDNYATRIVGDNLVIYTPYEIENLNDKDAWPVVRRWTPDSDEDDDDTVSRANRTPLLEARRIYQPVLRTAEPWVHTISVCPLGSTANGRNLDCRSTAFVGPSGSEFFVSPDNVFLWVWPVADDIEDQIGYRLHSRVPLRQHYDDEQARCMALPRPDRRDVFPSAVYRIPVNGRAPAVIGVNGAPLDQFSMDSREGEFRAMSAWLRTDCVETWERPADFSFLRIPLGSFDEDFNVARDRQITPLPPLGTRFAENRFADDYFVYGGRESWSSRPPRLDEAIEEEEAPRNLVVTVPVHSPGGAVITELPHNIVRTERVGNNMMLNGYRDDSGLFMSLLALSDAPRIASSAFLPRRYESEGRSHAFNSLVEADGSGMIGVPTVYRAEDSDRYWWRSEGSDVSYLSLTPELALSHVGELRMSEGDPTDESYRCEESCIDWYGNSRPIFTMGRVFGLMGIELVEGRVENGQMMEVQRLNLTVPPGN